MTLVACLGLTATPVANADPLDNIRGAVNGVRNGNSLCNPLQYSGQLEGYAQEWVRTAMALATLNTPTFPADAYPGDALGSIASGDPTAAATNKLISSATADIQKCPYYEFGVGMSRDDVTELSYVAVIVGKPPAPKPAPKPPANQLPPPPAAPPPAPTPPPQPKATVKSDVDVYDVPGGEGNVTGVLRTNDTVDFRGCQADNWCHVGGAPVPNGDGWVWGDFLQR
jgi:hypothetical protein